VASSDDFLSAGGVLAIVLGGIVYNHLAVARGARPRKSAARTPDTMMGRFVTHRGSVVGEVVGSTTDRLVLRQAGVHKAVPLSQAHWRDGELVLEGDVDWTVAEEDGRAWAGEGDSDGEAA